MSAHEARNFRSVQIDPMGKPRMTQRDRWKHRPVIDRYHAYCDKLRLQLPGYELPERLHLVFYLPMPKSWTKKRRAEMAGQPHDQKPDIDNLAKAFMDAFKAEDKHIYSLVAEKFWSEYGAVVVAELQERRVA